MHRCASIHQAWRLSYLDPIGFSSHEYPDRMFWDTSTPQAMLGGTMNRGYAVFHGHDIPGITTAYPQFRRFFRTPG
jgi:hypothetical protein